ncbi:MAG: efflux transporter outer membrane subunit [Planctomycetota bacterium]|jgi:NodT family efflux transporter outer membrane factor (OMF) lipoprotein
MRKLLLSLPLLAMAGCATEIAAVAAPIAEPAEFSSAGSVPLPERWWESLGDSELNRLIALALEGNLNLRAAWDRLSQAEAQARRDGAELWPELEGRARAGYRFADRDKDDGDYFLGLAASYEIDLWGRVRALHNAAGLDALAVEADLGAVALTLTAEVAAAWFSLQERRAQMAVLESQLRTNERVQELLALRFSRGLSRASEVLRQRQFTEATRGEQARLRGTIIGLEQRIAVLCGRSPRVAVVTDGGALIDLPAMPATGVPLTLLQRRPDLRRAALRVQSADQRVAAAVADRFPRLSLSADATTSGGDVGDLFDFWAANLAANLLAPIFDGGRRAAEADRARAAAAEALHGYGQAALEAFADVEDALTRERQLGRVLASLDAQLELSNAALERARDAFINGAADYLSVLDLITTQQRLVRDRVSVRGELLQARVDLCRALAGGWTLPRPGADGDAGAGAGADEEQP